MLRIGVDAMGAENGIEAVIEAVKEVATLHSGIKFVIFGNKGAIEDILHEEHNFDIISSEKDIPMDTKIPRRACLKYQNSSMALGLAALKDKTIDAFVSNGNTGALVAGAMNSKILGPLHKGVAGALTATVPQADDSYSLMLDVGANTRESAEINLQNAIMAVEYLKNTQGKQDITIGYLNVGTEDSKGNDSDKKTIQDLRKYFGGSVNVKNIEPDTLLNSGCDIMLTPGIRGNQILKTAEGVAKTFKKEIKSIAKIKMIFAGRDLKKNLGKYNANSGAICLGTDGIVIKSHGGASKDGIIGSLLQAIDYSYQQEKYNILGESKKALLDCKAWISEQSQKD